jgi:hypothetical protein
MSGSLLELSASAGRSTSVSTAFVLALVDALGLGFGNKRGATQALLSNSSTSAAQILGVRLVSLVFSIILNLLWVGSLNELYVITGFLRKSEHFPPCPF